MNSSLPFKDAMSNAGLMTKDPVISDGVLRRFHVQGDKLGSKNGWYVLFEDQISAGSFGSWKDGSKHNWCNREKSRLSPIEKRELDMRVRRARLKHQQQQKEKHHLASKRAKQVWKNSKTCSIHPYLKAKNVKSHGLKTYDHRLVVPMRDIEGKLHSIQLIDAEGNKRFLNGGRKKGCFFLIGVAGESLLISEGYATGATLNESCGLPVAIAFDAGNLIHVAKAFRSKYPNLNITICADNDANTDGNPGITKAKEAALAVGGKIAVPPCPGDFNDYYNGART